MHESLLQMRLMVNCFVLYRSRYQGSVEVLTAVLNTGQVVLTKAIAYTSQVPKSVPTTEVTVSSCTETPLDCLVAHFRRPHQPFH